MRRYAPGVYGLPGAAFLAWGDPLNEQLKALYAANRQPIAYVDETFHLEGTKRFYALALATVYPDQVAATRLTLTRFYGGSALHAAPMYQRAEYETLRQATELVATNHDGLDLVVCAQLADSDRLGDDGRRRCLEYLARKVHTDFGTNLFIIDSRVDPTQDRLDQFVFGDLRKTSAIGRDVRAHHARPSAEPLLGLPDVLAWSYRQEHTRGDTAWFEPMRELTQVQVL